METSGYTDESQKDETCLQFKMEKHYIKAWKISQRQGYSKLVHLMIWFSKWFEIFCGTFPGYKNCKYNTDDEYCYSKALFISY